MNKHVSRGTRNTWINSILQAKVIVASDRLLVPNKLSQQTYKERDYGHKFHKFLKSFMWITKTKLKEDMSHVSECQKEEEAKVGINGEKWKVITFETPGRSRYSSLK